MNTPAMPYEIAFTKPVVIVDREQYINECCVGGDIVSDALLPAIRQRYGEPDHNQEDWGWFIWFHEGDIRLSVDIFTDDADAGEFRIMLTSAKKRWLTWDRSTNTPELEQLRDLVVAELTKWQATGMTVEVAEG